MPRHIITLPTIFNKMTPRVDRSWKLEFETRELEGRDIEELANRLGTEGWVAHSVNDDLTANDVPEVEADAGMEGKTPSQRLRNSLYVLWKQSETKEPFETYYLNQMERIIEQVKSRLDG